MRIDVLTLFPGMFDSVLGESIVKRAIKKGLLKTRVHNLRDWTSDSHRTADDKPFGGGPGMVMKVEPVYKALKSLRLLTGRRSGKKGDYSVRVILMCPQGKKLDQAQIKRLAGYDRLVLICGHYEGVDERVRSFVDEDISIGDYILTCGEIPAMVVIDGVTRLLPGVLGDSRSSVSETFEDDLLEYPQYTRPSEFMGMKVPYVLLSGDHKNIEDWRRDQAIARTSKRRPDLLKRGACAR